MAHEAKLKIEQNEYEVLECNYEFLQPIKESGHPAGRPAGGLIHFIISSPDDSDLLFHEWMESKTEHKDGTISFAVMAKSKWATKSLTFKNAYCIRLQEYFSVHSATQMHTKITVSAGEIAFGEGESVVFKNDGKP